MGQAAQSIPNGDEQEVVTENVAPVINITETIQAAVQATVPGAVQEAVQVSLLGAVQEAVANEVQLQINKFLQANHFEIQDRQKTLLDLQIEEKKAQIKKENLQCLELQLRIEEQKKKQ